MVTTILKCSCGQDNHLVQTDEGWRYDEEKHGSCELAKGKCFNCHALIGTESQSQPDTDLPDTDEPLEDQIDLNAMSKVQLKQLAKISEAKLIEMLSEATTLNADD